MEGETAVPKAAAVKEGLEILLKYKPDGWCGAEHDELFGPMVKRKDMTPEDCAKLESIGWHYYDEDSEEGEGWAVFT